MSFDLIQRSGELEKQAKALADKGADHLAAPLYSESLDLWFHNPTCYQLALCLGRLGQHDEAIETLHGLLDEVPQHQACKDLLFLVMLHLCRFEDAENFVKADDPEQTHARRVRLLKCMDPKFAGKARAQVAAKLVGRRYLSLG